MFNKIIAVSAAAVMGFSLLTLLPVTADAAESGTCGENLTWVLDDNGVLTISGTGDMYDFSGQTDTPWHDYCGAITILEIENGITSIGDDAFGGMIKISTIEIPDSVTRIGKRSFYDCEELISINISKGVTSIDDISFLNCGSLTEINVDAENTVYSSEDGVLFDKDKMTLIRYPVGKAGAYTVPESVNSIGDLAFENCRGLTDVTIPDNVTSIGGAAFYGCRNLASVTLSNSVTSIGDYTFSNCDQMTSITIPDSVTSIGTGAFVYCDNLMSITIPSSVTSISSEAFLGCNAFESITIENPDCQLADSSDTIDERAVIYGYSGSTAQAYAEKYGRTFVALDDKPADVSKGNINGDGTVGLDDAVLVLDHYAKTAAGLTSELTEEQLAAADINGDGAYGLDDAACILTYYAQSAAGLEPSWEDIIGA